ncbi:MAG: urease accessory protein UreH [Thermodesulfobacteriota bacterium]|jgi:xanthosine utilization system XapX-like protein
MTSFATLALGFMLGLQHALDSDHLVAVSTIVTRERSLWRALAAGLSWGVGHTVTLLLVGLIVLGLKTRIPAPVELSLECLVGMVLVALGLATLSDGWRKKVHARVPAGDEHPHFHTHAASVPRHPQTLRLGVRPLLVGMVHGLAGSAALMLLVFATLPSVGLGVVYISLFGCGSILGMGVVSLLLGLFFSLATDRLRAAQQGLQWAVGAVSTACGAWIVIEIGFIQGLFLG